MSLCALSMMVRMPLRGVALAVLLSWLSPLPAGPTGCSTPNTVAEGLRKVSSYDWGNLSEAKVKSIWPTHLIDIECDNDGCRALGAQERMIKNNCECCQLFTFDVTRDDKGSLVKESLNNIVIHYSEDTKGGLLNDAKLLAEAMGLSDSDAATIRFGEQQPFHWAVAGSKPPIALLFVHLYRQGSGWTVYLSLSRHSL